MKNIVLDKFSSKSGFDLNSWDPPEDRQNYIDKLYNNFKHEIEIYYYNNLDKARTIIMQAISKAKNEKPRITKNCPIIECHNYI